MKNISQSQRILQPQVLKQIAARIQNQIKPNRLMKELEIMVGRKTTTRRWLSIKQKYNVKNQPQTFATSDVILEINLKERLKNEARMQRHQRTKTELIERLSTPKVSTPQFFEYNKRNIRYLENTQEKRSVHSCQLLPQRNKYAKKPLWNVDQRKNRRKTHRLPHPILKMYNKTSENVIQSFHGQRKYDSPFEWFASFDDLNPY